jgi:VIT1/CCC1 family predicted Fe2+/Mn2+ transporter
MDPCRNANDGIVSTTSLILGVVGAHASHEAIVLAGFAGLVAGSMSMATGEFVSVSSQSDWADIAERRFGVLRRTDG